MGDATNQRVNLKRRILIPQAIALIVLLSVFIFSFSAHNRRDLDTRFVEIRNSANQILHDEIKNDASQLLAVIYALEQDEILRRALRNADRKLLLQRSTALFAHLHTEYKTTHFYFSDPHRVNLLRVHQPNRFGDRINRFTTLDAETSGRPSWGVELGPLGTFTLRVVVPWFDDGKLIGYVELGEEIEHIIAKVRANTHTELVVLINKTLLKHDAWSDGMRMLGRTDSWDLLPTQVVAYSTFNELKPDLLRSLQNLSPESDQADVAVENHSYRRQTIPLKEASGLDAGMLVVMLDITANLKQAWQIAGINIVIALIIGSLLIWLFYNITRHTEQELVRSQRELQAESQQREKMQHDHISELRHRTLHDSLTGLPNRIQLLEILSRAIRESCDRDTPVMLTVVDVDRLRAINDTLGHHVGDWMLQTVGERLRTAMPETNTVARIGASEFAIILPGCAPDTTDSVAHSLRGILEKPFEADGVSLTIDTHIGFAFSPLHGDDAELLIRRADVAVNHAKKDGLDFAIYDQKKDPYSRRQLALAAELRLAIRHDNLKLHYQPKINLRNGDIVDVEALVRWAHPQEGMIPPSDFIPLAEQTGLIRPLTLWVLDEALQQCRTWLDDGLQLRVAVNLSAINLQDPGLPAQIAERLRINAVSPKLLILEITESTIMADPAHSIAVLGKLRDMGVALSIDDFGTGYSSLSYLSRLPVNELKIDRSFIAGMMSSEGDTKIVRATIDLAHDLGLNVIAEGIETRDAWVRLMAMGCDVAQGYYMSRPLPADELAIWVKESWNTARKRFDAYPFSRTHG